MTQCPPPPQFIYATVRDGQLHDTPVFNQSIKSSENILIKI